MMIGIHTPESQAEQVVENVRRNAREQNLDFPILIDTQKKNWQAWGNTIWPSLYLIDKRGYVRAWWYGELNWQGAEGEKIMRARIEELLAE
jgi:peroxiredoxin